MTAVLLGLLSRVLSVSEGLLLSYFLTLNTLYLVFVLVAASIAFAPAQPNRSTR